MNIDIYAFSRKGAKLCDKIIEGMNDCFIEAFVPEAYVNAASNVKMMGDSLYDSIEKAFREKQCIIFIGALGIAVRAIAPFIKSKKTDPAVICIDERGKNAISLLSGHIGGANKLTLKVAQIIGANPIITTATDINGKFAVDEWAHNNNMHIVSLKSAKYIASKIIGNEKIGLKSDFEIIGEIPDEIEKVNTENQNFKAGISISLDSCKKTFDINLNLVPKIVSVGVGCRKGEDYKIIFNAIKDVLTENNISYYGIKSINSIDLKKNEQGIVKAADAFEVPFYTYTKDELNKTEGNFSKSSFVKSVAGVDSVCERAAVMDSSSKILDIKKTVRNSVTVAASIDDYKVNFNY